MSGLGNFLEAVYGPGDGFRAVRATMRHWHNRNAAARASGASADPIGRRKVPTASESKVDRTELSFWMKAPEKFRIQKQRERDGQCQESLLIVNGDRWWQRDHQGHVETDEVILDRTQRRRQPPLTDFERHFSHASLREFFVALTLESLGEARVAERDCIGIRAIPRPGGRLWPHWLPSGADEYEFWADPERGVLLSIAGKVQGEVFEMSEVVQVEFDAPLDDGLFTYLPQVGEQVRPADPIIERLTLSAAIARVPFVVLVPTRVLDSSREAFEVMYHPSSLRSPRSHLTLMHRGAETFWIDQSHLADPACDELEWEVIEHDNLRMLISDPGDAGMRGISLERHGTHVTMWSNLSRDRLLDLASSLKPAASPQDPSRQ